MVARIRSITKPPAESDGLVHSLNRALRLLELLAEDDDGVLSRISNDWSRRCAVIVIEHPAKPRSAMTLRRH